MTLRNKMQGYDKEADMRKAAEAKAEKSKMEKAQRERSAKERKDKEKAAMKGLPFGGDIMEAMRRQDRDAIRMIMQARNAAQGYTKAPPPKPKKRNQVCAFCAYYNLEGETVCEMCESSLNDAILDNDGQNKPIGASGLGNGTKRAGGVGSKSAKLRNAANAAKATAASSASGGARREAGVIDDFKDAFLALGPTVKHAFDEIDLNQDGAISRSEFKKVRVPPQPLLPAAAAAAAAAAGTHTTTPTAF